LAQDTVKRSDAETKIRAAIERWRQAANRRDWKTALDVWAPDLVGWYPGEADATYKREADYAAVPVNAADPVSTFEVTINEVIVDETLAVVRDTWVITTKSKAGAPTVEKLRSFEVWRRQPDKAWKIVRWISAPEPKTPKP
jgi:ketosteroid isomerase-like protein